MTSSFVLLHKREGDVFYDQTGNVRESPCHPVVEQVANEMLNRAEEEASSVLSTAVAKLGLYTDPVVARNTAVSDFRIQDIMDNDSPVSLYLVLNPTNIQRLKPLVRLFISQLELNRFNPFFTLRKLPPDFLVTFAVLFRSENFLLLYLAKSPCIFRRCHPEIADIYVRSS